MPILPQVSLPPGMVAVPENRAKAAAFDRWMAQGGRPGRKSGKFLTGPQKGMTYDQAKQRFEGMWGSAPDALKEKYAKRAGDETQMAPSQRPVAEKVDMSPLAVQKRRMAAYGHEFDANGRAVPIGQKTAARPAYDKDGNGIPDMIQRPATVNPAATSGAGRGKPIGTPEERAKVSQMVAEGGDYATAAPPPASAKKTVNPAATSGAGRGKPIGTPEERAKVSQMVAEGGDYATAFVGVPGTVPTEAFQDMGMRAAAAYDRMQQDNATPHLAGVRDEKAAADKAAADRQAAAKVAEVKAMQEKQVKDERARLGLADPAPAPSPVAATPAPAPAPTAPIQPMGPPASAKTPATPAAPYGQPVIGGSAPKVNRLTGLPFGYLPGDSTEGMDAAMKERADASTARMNSVAPPPRAIPVVTPARPPSVEQRAADEMRRQAAINANPSKVNPDDPKKFFTGRVLPLDQLNNPAKAPSSGYQVGGVGPGGGRVLSVRPAFRR